MCCLEPPPPLGGLLGLGPPPRPPWLAYTLGCNKTDIFELLTEPSDSSLGTSSSSQDGEEGLSDELIAVICLVVLLVVCLTAVLFLWFRLLKRKKLQIIPKKNAKATQDPAEGDNFLGAARGRGWPASDTTALVRNSSPRSSGDTSHSGKSPTPSLKSRDSPLPVKRRDSSTSGISMDDSDTLRSDGSQRPTSAHLTSTSHFLAHLPILTPLSATDRPRPPPGRLDPLPAPPKPKPPRKKPKKRRARKSDDCEMAVSGEDSKGVPTEKSAESYA